MYTPFNRTRAWAGAVLLVLASASATHADVAEIRKARAVRVLVVGGLPQFFATVQRAPQPGLEREILQSFFNRQDRDIEVSFRVLPSPAAVLQALQKGEGDIAGGGLVSGSADVAFSAEVLPTRYVVVTGKRAHPVEKLEDLREDRIGLTRGTTWPEAVLNAGLPHGQLDDSFAPGGLLTALKTGKISACILGVEYAIPAKAQDPELQLGMYLGTKLSVAFALRKDEPQLLAALDEYVANLRRTATWNRLVLKYFGDSTIEILKASR
jgi:membrane-bound lytic murein transglycosylase F